MAKCERLPSMTELPRETPRQASQIGLGTEQTDVMARLHHQWLSQISFHSLTAVKQRVLCT